jgi:predicted membrane-bound spermidine synthase
MAVLAKQSETNTFESDNLILDRSWYFLFFVVSGFCGLVYEVVWLRLAMASFGVTTALVSIVLSMFMAGLGLGSAAAGILARRILNASGRRAMRFYSGAELLVGVSSGVVPLQFSLLQMSQSDRDPSARRYSIRAKFIRLREF